MKDKRLNDLILLAREKDFTISLEDVLKNWTGGKVRRLSIR